MKSIRLVAVLLCGLTSLAAYPAHAAESAPQHTDSPSTQPGPAWAYDESLPQRALKASLLSTFAVPLLPVTMTFGPSVGYYMAGRTTYATLSGLGRLTLMAGGFTALVFAVGSSFCDPDFGGCEEISHGAQAAILTSSAAMLGGAGIWAIVDLARMKGAVRDAQTKARESAAFNVLKSATVAPIYDTQGNRGMALAFRF